MIVGLTGRRLTDVFLSYGHGDVHVARRFAECLEREGFAVWWDTSLRSGEAFDAAIETALKRAQAVVVLWSRSSVQSRWVRSEAMLADRCGTLVPVLIEPCELPIMFQLTHTVDLAHWQGAADEPAWLALVADVRRFAAGDADSRRPVPDAVAPAVSRAPSVPLPNRLSIAVLPFVNMSGDAEQEYFSDGISEDIITDLSKVSALSVISRNSAFTFKGRHVDLPQVARSLKVSHVLEGSVRRSGNRVRITAQLIDAATNNPIWAERYDRELRDIFALQDEISQAIVSALKLKLFAGEKQSIEDRGTSHIEAYEKVLRARGLFHHYGPEEFMRGIELYREALILDPEFARGWYELYIALGRALVQLPHSAAALRPEIAHVSERIKALAPDSWWTHFVCATEYVRDRKWSEAEAALAAVAKLAPKSGIDVITGQATLLARLGRSGEAVALYERARRIDPLSMGVSTMLQYLLDSAGRSDAAQAEYLRSKDLPGGRGLCEWLALLRVWSRQNADPEAVERQFRVVLTHENLPLALHHTMQDRLGNAEAARDAIRQAYEDPQNQDAGRLSVIAWYADHFGDKDVALGALRRAYVDLQGTTGFMIWWPFEGGLRADPRFKAILRDLGLADYFRTTGNWGDFCRPVGTDDFECH